MRKNLYSFLLTALCSMLGLNVWAQDLNSTFIDGTEYYEIGTANDLATLANLVNSGEEMDANAVLTADIDMADLIAMDGWTAIGNWASTANGNACYKGHFNGQGHKITGFNATSTHNYYGIFGVISTGALIENFSIYGTMNLGHKTGGVVAYSRDATPTIRNVNSYLNINVTEAATTAERPGGILGSAVNGTTVVENCIYSGTIDVGGHTGNIGGIVGYVNNNVAAIVNITNCLFDGEIQNETADGQCGGIVGYNNAGKLTIKNCLSIGTIITGTGNDGMFIGRLNGSNTVFANNYYVGTNVNGTSSGATASGDAPVKVTATQLASGEICYALNESVSGGENWFQTLNDDNYPFPYNGGIHDPIYLNGRQHCDGTAYEGSTISNQDLGIATDAHDFQDGFCTYCGEFKPDAFEPVDGYFQIASGKQLKWFAAYVNQVSVAANAVLTADIDMADIEWTPIGIGSGNAAPGATAYTGTFDGQGHTITNFKAEGAGHLGLFGDTSGATIKNFRISGNLTVTGGYGGGVVAWPINTTIENVFSRLAVSVPNSGTHHVGGVVGSARGNNTIVGCSFDGSMTVAAGSTDNFAGIAAYITGGDKVMNCASYGYIIFKDASCAAGGVVGYLNSTAAVVKNCLCTSAIIFDGEGDPKYGAAILGRTKGFSSDLVTNNYWRKNGARAAAKKDDGTDPIDAGGVTAEQLASGEVTVALGIAFRQNIDEDDYPLLDATHNVIAKITDAGYATLFVPNAEVAVPAGVTAYTAEIAENERNGKQHLALAELEGSIPAQTAVILKGAEGIYEFAASAEEVPDGAFKIFDKEVDGSLALVKGWAAPVQENVLKGAAEDVDAAGKYVLAKVDGKACFALATSGTIKAGKAYLEIASDAKAFYFSFDDATGINKLNESNGLNNVIYNLAGQRVGKMQRGINITGGKKILK